MLNRFLVNLFVPVLEKSVKSACVASIARFCFSFSTTTKRPSLDEMSQWALGLSLFRLMSLPRRGNVHIAIDIAH
jgi:hypothetical protein